MTSLALAEQTIPKGRIGDPVPSSFDSTQTHAVYIPKSYTPEKKWPILFAFEPRSQGKIPVELFQEAAERLGWIIISSNHYLSDDPNAKNFDVLKAMWSDSHRWFSIDEKRIYATGFSGGARMAWGMDYVFPKQIAGVIGVGAGTHPDRPPSRETAFLWYGISGDRDFNYLEMRDLDRQLQTLSIPHRVEFFDGRHEWPPAEYCVRALDWMELQAMKQNRRARDESWIQQQFHARLQKADQLQTSGNPLKALEEYSAIQADFTGLIDTGVVPTKVKSLSESESVRKALKERQKAEEKEQELVHAHVGILGNFRNGVDNISTGKLKSELRISHLLKEAKNKAKTFDGLSAQRLLETILSQTSFYIPQYLVGKKDYNRAITSLSIAAEIRPESPWVWHSTAAVYALKGEQEAALKNLQLAVSRGLKQRKYIDEEKAFDSLRTNTKFQELVKSLSVE